MIEALLDTDLGSDGVFEGADGEGESWEALVYFSEEGTRLLKLQVVLSVELSLVDSSSELTFLGLALASRDVNIEADNVTWGEFELLNALLCGFLVDHNIVTIYKVLLEHV